MKGEEILKKRKSLGLTQEELAKEIGVSRKTIQNYENEYVKVPETKSEMLRNYFKGRISGNNITVGSNSGNIAGGNIIQVTLPEAGKQKIIKPDGSIIIVPISPDGDYQDKDNPVRNENLSLLEKIELQRQLIESLQAQITMLKGGKG